MIDARPEQTPAAAPETPDAGLATGSNPPICPYLMSESGVWRLSVPSREHRCAAFDPPAALAVEKQARLCLTDRHPTCATYTASLAARAARLAPVVAQPTRWRLGRTASVIEEPGGLGAILIGLVLDRRRWPAIPAVILVATLLTLAVSGFRPGLPATVTATGTPAATQPPTPSPSASPTPAPTQTPEPSTSPSPSLSPTATPGPTPEPTYRTYRVKSGDNLTVIAARFGTTVSAIATLNNLADPSRLSVGQILLIPW